MNYTVRTLDIKGFLGAIPPYFFSTHACKIIRSRHQKLRRPAVPWPTARPRAVREWTWAAAIHSGALQPRAAATRAYLGLARTYVPRNRALIVFDRYQTEGDGRHGTKQRATEGGGGSREEAAARRRRRWPEASGGGLREAGTRGRRRAEGGVGGRRCCRVRRRKTPGRCDRPVAWTKR